MTRQFDEEQINANRIKAGGKRTVHWIRPEIVNIPTDCCNLIHLRGQQKMPITDSPPSYIAGVGVGSRKEQMFVMF